LALTIGRSVSSQSGRETLGRARLRAALLPDLLIEAQRIANTVETGWHGRRRQGSGDSFWQFRPYDAGESMSRIDWRRSARDDAITVRDQEWEAAHTIWVWADNSSSMLFKSESVDVSKQSRGLVIALSMIELLARSGERVGWPGVTPAFSSRNAAERIASQLITQDTSENPSFPQTDEINKRSELIVVSDFLEPVDETIKRIQSAAQSGLKGIVIQVIDPAEEHFPYSGRTEFQDPETGRKFLHGRAEELAREYKDLFQARRETLTDQCKRLGWQHLIHHTDQLASTVLVAAHQILSDRARVNG